MKLKEVRISNFRQYYGEQRPVFFARTKEKNVTLIYGVNGAGKSNLFKAINWCIYGERVLDDGVIPNKEAIKETKPGDSITVKVQVHFTHNGEEYRLSRNMECYIESENDNRQSPEEFVMMKIEQGGKTTKIDNPIGQINAILPENVRTYFLFDGEKIDNFSRPESADDVRNAIYNVLKLEVLERGKKHLEDIADEYRQELKRIAGAEVQDLLTKHEQKKKKKDELEARQNELNEQIKSAEKKIEEISDILEDMEESRQLQQERKKLEKERGAKQEDLEACREKIQKIATSSMTSINKHAVEKALDLLHEKRKKGEIPSNIREQFLQDIIDSKECICGRTFEDGGSEHNHLEKMKKGNVSGALEEEVISLTGNLQAIHTETENNMNQLGEQMRARTTFKDTIEKLENEIDEISRQLKDSRQEDVEKLERKRESFKSDVNNGNIEIGGNKTKINQLKEELQELDQEITKARSSKEREQKLGNKVAIAQKAADAIDSIYQQFADNMREGIENQTKEIFAQLIWKDTQFQNIQLNGNYQLEIIDRWGSPAALELSAGERQILSLAFITAMAKESGEEAPLVMDTPFGRLSKLHRAKITENIPRLTDQMVLFITDEEMNEEMARNIKPYVGETYHLNFDDNTGCTTIEQE